MTIDAMITLARMRTHMDTGCKLLITATQQAESLERDSLELNGLAAQDFGDKAAALKSTLLHLASDLWELDQLRQGLDPDALKQSSSGSSGKMAAVMNSGPELAPK